MSSVLIGIGLSAACGFKTFLPLLGMSVFSLSGQLELAPEFNWIASYYALIAFTIAAVMELLEYYFPPLANLFAKIAVPLSAAAGAIATASAVVEIDPFLRWSLAVIAGSGVSGTVRIKLAQFRKAVTVSVGNFGLLLTIFELISSFLLTAVAVAVPNLLVYGLVFYSFIIVKKFIYSTK